MSLNTEVGLYFANGCGRCPRGGTPECSVRFWPTELALLRKIVLQSGLTETVKWGVLCYTWEQANIAILGAFREYCSLSFFKGALLNDPRGILEKPGENTQAARLVRITTIKQIRLWKSDLEAFLQQAIELERAGTKVECDAKSNLVFPIELEQQFVALPVLRTAFAALTPGRQRGYILHFTGAKQSQTRKSRIEKCIPQILEGRGMHD